MQKIPLNNKVVIVNSALVLVSVIIALMIGEIYMRIDEVRGNTAKKNFTYTLSQERWSGTERYKNAKPLYMSKSFREPIAIFPKPPRTLRILALGDSFTWGEYVKKYDDLWPAVLEKKLNALLATMDVEVYNCGARGFTTANELELLCRFGFYLEPDIIVVEFTLNDPIESGPNFARNGEENLTPNVSNLIANKTLHQFFSQSALFRFFNSEFQARQLRKHHSSVYHDLYRDDFKGWHACKESLKAIGKLAAERNAKVIVMIFPPMWGGNWTLESFPCADIHQKVARAAKDAGLYVLDLLPVFVAQKKNFNAFRALEGHDGHPNEAAHALAAQALQDFIAREIIGH